LGKSRVEEEVEVDTKGAGSGHGAASTKEGETVQEGDTPAAPPNRGPRPPGRRHQKRATWAEVVAAGGVNIPAVFNLLGLNLGGKGVHRSSNRRPGTPKRTDGGLEGK
jgi:hypothetical protein